MPKKNAQTDLDALRKRLVESLGPLAENARLIADMPLVAGQQVRLCVTAGPMRVTAWGTDLATATVALAEKIASVQRSSLGERREDSPLLPL